jgi:hypothetical protein
MPTLEQLINLTPTMHHFTVVLQALACLFITGHAVFALTKMSEEATLTISAAYVVLATAGACGLLSCFVMSDIFICLFAVGIALFLLGDRRKPA